MIQKIRNQFQIIKIQLYHNTKVKMFFSNPYAVWNQTIVSYQCYYLATPLYHPNNFLQNIISIIREKTIFQPENTPLVQSLIQNQRKILKSKQILENAQIYRQNFINHSILENSKKMKKTMKNHNVLPNIMNTMLSYIRRRNKTGKIIQKIINKQQNMGKVINPTTSRYYAYQIYLHSKIPKSKHQSSLRFIVNHFDPSLDAFSVEEQLFYNRVCRILIFELLNQEFLLAFLTTRKSAKTSKPDHMKARRFIFALLKQGLEIQDLSNLQ